MVSCSSKTVNIGKTDIPFIADSFDEYAKQTLGGGNFLKSLFDFSAFEKDNINEETIELLEPYITLKFPTTGEDVFTGQVAKKANAALEGMTVWAAAMSDYHKQSKIVKPKLRLLEIKNASLAEAEANLADAQSELDACKALKERLQKKFDD
jgi:dynein heavy chain